MTSTTITERDERMIALAHDGLTLAEIGAQYDLTRERVRQILAAHGTRTLKHDDRVLKAADDWRESGQVRDAHDVLREHGLAANTRNLAMIRRAVPELNLPPQKGKRASWDEQAVVEAVRRAALRGGIDPATGWFTIKQYAALRADGDPSTATIGANYLWSSIMEQAGFRRENASTRRGRPTGLRPKQFSDEQLDAAVMDYLNNRDDKLSAIGLERFLRASPQHPSMATIRNRFRARGIDSIPGIFVDVQSRLG